MLDEPSTRMSPRPNPPMSRSSAHSGKPAGLLTAARVLLNSLSRGRGLTAGVLRDAMTGPFGGTDADGAWAWKDAYDAAEAAVVLFIQRYGSAMRREAGRRTAGSRQRCSRCSNAWQRSNPPIPGDPRNSSAFSNSPRPCRSPMRPFRPPRSGPATACWSPRRAPASSPSWPTVRSARNRQPAALPQRTRPDAGGTARRALSGRFRRPAQRRDHRRLPARARAVGGADEPAVLGQPRGRAPPP